MDRGSVSSWFLPPFLAVSCHLVVCYVPGAYPILYRVFENGNLFKIVCSCQSRVPAVEEAAGVVVDEVELDVGVRLTGTARPARRKSIPVQRLPSCSYFLSDTDKRIHQSWGGDDGNTELKTEEAVTNDVAVEGAAANDWGPDTAPASNDWGATETNPAEDPWATPAAAPEGAATATPAADAEKPEREGRPRREREPEEEDNTLTLEQYLAQKKEKEGSLVPKLEGTRKANEGADGNIWKDVVPLQKEEENSYFVGKVHFAFILGSFFIY